MVSNSQTINVSGEDVVGTGNAGGSGGGGGGIAALDINHFAGTCYVLANGGKGGNTQASSASGTCLTGTGTGGGGGGGLIWFSSTSTFAGLTQQINAGNYGLPGTETTSDDCLELTGYSGITGITRTGIELPLNGFLFNFIYKKHDTICAGTAPAPIEASMPKGRNGAFTFLWQSSTDGLAFADVTNQIAADSVIYAPGILHQTTWFRRIVTTGSGPAFVADTSNTIKIFAWDSIQGNSIGTSQLLCAGDVASVLSGNTTSGGNGVYGWIWERRTPSGAWNTIGSSVSYSPGSMLQTYLYRRNVTSASNLCHDTSNLITLTVQNDISGNILTGSQTICTADIAANLTGDTIAGGDESNYTYLWQSSLNQSVWNAAAGNPSTAVYSPGSPVSTAYFRRIVESGACEDTSDNIVTVTVLPSLGGYAIGADQKICYNTTPATLTGTGSPSGGTGMFTYRWQQSTNNSAFADIIDAEVTSYSPAALTDTVWYRRIIESSACIDTSNVLKIIVVPAISNTITTGADSICYGQKPSNFDEVAATGGNGVFAYLWETNSGSGYSTASGVASGMDYTTPALFQSATYRRKATSDGCETFSPEVTITVFDTLSNNRIEGEPYLENCYNQVLVAMASEPQGGQPGDRKYSWQQSTDNMNWATATSSHSHTGQNYTSDPLIDSLYLRRIVASGPENECIDTTISTLVHINPLPTAQLQPFDTVVCDRAGLVMDVQATGEPPLLLYFSDIGEFTINSLSEAIDLVADAQGLQSKLYSIAFDSVQDHNGCLATEISGEVYLEVLGYPFVDAGSDIAVCDSSALLSAAVPGFGTSQWQNTDFIFTDASIHNSGVKPVVSLDTAIFGELVWRVANDFCLSADTLLISFYKQPERAEIPQERIDLFEVFSTPVEAVAPQIGRGVWSVAVGQGDFIDSLAAVTTISNLPYGLNKVVWTVTNGVCVVVTDSIEINVSAITSTNAFSPNNDFINDNFEILGLKPDEKNEIIIFNRWGSQVFTSPQYQNNWDGRDTKGNDLPDDVYYYVLKTYKGEVITGYVVIRR